jgi:hypothetical protein
VADADQLTPVSAPLAAPRFEITDTTGTVPSKFLGCYEQVYSLPDVPHSIYPSFESLWAASVLKGSKKEDLLFVKKSDPSIEVVNTLWNNDFVAASTAAFATYGYWAIYDRDEVTGTDFASSSAQWIRVLGAAGKRPWDNGGAWELGTGAWTSSTQSFTPVTPTLKSSTTCQ